MNSLAQRQGKLGRGGLIALIIATDVVMMVSTDMYLPALPHMGEALGAPAGLVNLTLVGFFLFFAVGVLLFGPLSDAHGRRPFLIGGGLLYVAASCLCALSGSIAILIAGRVVQALGAGCIFTVSTAMIKDCFVGRDRDFVLSLTQAISVIGPMLAPFLGSLALILAGWREIFWLLALLGALCSLPAFFLEEPLSPGARSRESMLGALGRLFVVGKNRAFLSLLLAIAVLTMPYMTYIAVCSYVYIEHFKLSNAIYSILFAANASLSVIAPFVYLKIGGKIQPKKIISLCIIASAASGLLLLAFGTVAPLAFFLSFAPFVFAEGIIRPCAMILLLDQQEGDTGSAASLINFLFSIVGSLGTALGGLGWSSLVSGLGLVTLGCALAAGLGWVLIRSSKAPLRGL